MDAITATIDGAELFHAEHPPALFTASVRMRLDEAPPGTTQTTLETLSSATGGWQVIEADIRGQRTTDPTDRFGLTVSLGDVTVDLTDLNANVHVTYAQPTEQPEDAVIPAFILDAGHPENIDQPVSGPVVSRAEITVGQTATVIAQDIVDARVDTRQAMNSAERDAKASHVTFGEDGLVEVTHWGVGVKVRLNAPAQMVSLSLALTRDDGSLGSAHVDAQSTGDMDVHITSGLFTILQLVNVQEGMINAGGSSGDVMLTFGENGYLSLPTKLGFDAGGEVAALLDPVGTGGVCGGDGGEGGFLNLAARHPKVLGITWDTAGCGSGHFGWRLAPTGSIDIHTAQFDVNVRPHADMGEDWVGFNVNGNLEEKNCEEHTLGGNPLKLDRAGEHAEKCALGEIVFETFAPETTGVLPP